MPVMRMRTQAQEIEQTLNQEIIFARLCAAFAMLALVMACIGLYGTMAVRRHATDSGDWHSPGVGCPSAYGDVDRVARSLCAWPPIGLAISVPLAFVGVTPRAVVPVRRQAERSYDRVGGGVF